MVSGFPIPEPKTFLLEGGRSVTVPDLSRQEPAYKAAPLTPSSGEPLVPTGDAMLSEAGPGAYSNRDDVPEMTTHGEPFIQPLRVAKRSRLRRRTWIPEAYP